MAIDTFRIKLPIHELVKEILDRLPDSVWQDPQIRFLDPAFGGGQFLLEIRRRLLAAGHSQDNIADRIWGCESLLTRVKYVQNWFKSGLHNLYVQDPISYDWGDMKFDVIVGNPPYQKGLWRKFVSKSLQLSSKHVCLVAPDATATFSSRSDQFTEMLMEHGLQSITDCTHHFPGINSGKIVVYCADVTKPHNPDALMDHTPAGMLVTKVLNYVSTHHMEAMLSGKRSAADAGATKHEKPKKGRIHTLLSVGKDSQEWAYVDEAHVTQINASEYWLTNRYFGKDSNSPLLEASGQKGIGTNIMAIRRLKGWSKEDFLKVYLDPLFVYVLNYLRQGAFDTSPRHLKQLPVIKLHGTKLYTKLGLTDQEVELIKSGST